MSKRTSQITVAESPQPIDSTSRRVFILSPLQLVLALLLTAIACFGLTIVATLSAMLGYGGVSVKTPVSEPTQFVAPTQTPTAQQNVTTQGRAAVLWSQVDAWWDNDWRRVVNALRELEGIEGRTPRWIEKTYAAYYNYGQQLLGQGFLLEAAGTFSNALQVKPDGAEARAALLALTPTSITPPKPTTAVLPPPPLSCPQGCVDHIAGCDIKGNISIPSGEKIYHVPGGKFYDRTVIDPLYGERWFCTENEARANGWRKSSQ